VVPTARRRIAAFGANIRPRAFRAARLVRVPSHDTIGLVLAKVDTDALDRVVQVGQAIVAVRQHRDADRRQRLRRIALDGKAPRTAPLVRVCRERSASSEKSKAKTVHCATAWLAVSQLVPRDEPPSHVR
jgi:hypothetical protein